MDERNEKDDLVGHPSDYGTRTLADEERERTADGEPRVERGTADVNEGEKPQR
jgi:hypothetical protein